MPTHVPNPASLSPPIRTLELMTGPATYASDEGIAARARRQLDEIAVSVQGMEAAQRDVIAKLVELWPFEGWKAAGARSPKDWLRAYTGQSAGEARRLSGIAELCTRNSRLCDAVLSGRFPMGWAERLSRSVTTERAPFLTDGVVDAFLRLADARVPDDQFGDAVRFWAGQADQELEPRRVQRQSLVASPSLFGGGEVHANLLPGSFETVLAAVNAFTQDPDPAGAPYRRTLSERRADALDDLAHFGLTHGGQDGCLRAGDAGHDPTEDDVYDGDDDSDILDDLLDLVAPERPADGGDPADYMRALRRTIRRRVLNERRRAQRQLRPRSGARVDVKIDLETLLDRRELDDLDGVVHFNPDAWNLTRDAADLLGCDATLVATLFRGRRILDANAEAEQFSTRQRRAIAGRDRHCVFPGCRRPPRHCDAHHLVERGEGGPTVVDNGCLLCRHHHRLIHLYGWTLTHDDQWNWTATDAHGQAWSERRPSDSPAR